MENFPPQTPVQPSIQENTQLEPKAAQSGNKPWTLLLIILVVLLLATSLVLAFFLLKTKTPPIIMQNVFPTPITPITQVIETQEEITVPNDWKTYKNTKYNFSFRYPNDWSNYSMNDFSEIDTNGNEKVLYLGPSKSTSKPPQLVQITIYLANDYSEPELLNESNCTKKELLIGIDKLSAQYKTCNGLGSDGYITFKSGDYIFVIDLLKGNANFENIIDQILSTFKFADSNKESYTEDTGVKDQKRYVSPKLGISFLYITRYPSGLEESQDKMVTKEIDNKIYLRSSSQLGDYQGQFVEVFEKDPNETLAQAIERQFLVRKDKSQCFVSYNTLSTGSQQYPANYKRAEIAFPEDEEFDMESMFKKSEYCSTDYARTNGIRYFLEDIKHPDKFVFFSIGQEAIMANETQTWQDTITFLD